MVNIEMWGLYVKPVANILPTYLIAQSGSSYNSSNIFAEIAILEHFWVLGEYGSFYQCFCYLNFVCVHVEWYCTCDRCL